MSSTKYFRIGENIRKLSKDALGIKLFCAELSPTN